MGKYSEVSTTTEINASEPCCVEFALKAYFPEDKQQTYLAKGMPFKARTPRGIVEGKLDGNGEAVIPDTGIGSVTIEVMPDIDKKIRELRGIIKKELDALISQEREEAAAIEQEYKKSSWLKRRYKDIEAIGSGLWGFVEGVFGALWSILKGVGSALSALAEEVGEYILDPLNAPETFKEDIKAVKAKYKALRRFADEDLEAYFVLASDKKTWEIFENFASEYIKVQHYSELMEGGTEATLGVMLTIVSAGAGGVAAAGAAGARLAATARKLAPVIKKLVEVIKYKKWFKKKKTVESNKRNEVTTEHKPYSKSRPSYKKGQVEQVWENAKDRNGKVYDPHTKEEITWDKSKPRNGQWDMGHKGRTYKELHDDYMSGKITKEQFLKEYHDPENYHPQTVNSNRSRRYDK